VLANDDVSDRVYYTTLENIPSVVGVCRWMDI